MNVKIKKESLKEINEYDLNWMDIEFKSLSDEQKNVVFLYLDSLINEAIELKVEN